MARFSNIQSRNTVDNIISDLLSDPLYIRLFSVQCPVCGSTAWIQHCKWNNDQIYEVGVNFGGGIANKRLLDIG